MTITTVAPAIDAESAEKDRRAAYTAGLRILADVLDQHDEVPLPYDGSDDEVTIHFLFGDDPRAQMAAAARAIPCNWRKNDPGDGSYDAMYLDLQGQLAGLKLKLVAYRTAVCERVVTGTREVTVTVPDPEALAAVPEVTVTKFVDDVEWRCGSVLALAKKDGKGETA